MGTKERTVPPGVLSRAVRPCGPEFFVFLCFEYNIQRAAQGLHRRPPPPTPGSWAWMGRGSRCLILHGGTVLPVGRAISASHAIWSVCAGATVYSPGSARLACSLALAGTSRTHRESVLGFGSRVAVVRWQILTNCALKFLFHFSSRHHSLWLSSPPPRHSGSSLDLLHEVGWGGVGDIAEVVGCWARWHQVAAALHILASAGGLWVPGPQDLVIALAGARVSPAAAPRASGEHPQPKPRPAGRLDHGLVSP